jgi:SAM-dependent methyltransferase
MKKENIYTKDEIERTYKEVHDLLVTKHIIKSYSTNKNDIRDIALNGIDLSKKGRVLELGCGYGFFIEKLNNRLLDDAVICGVDLVENNREIYLNTVGSIGYRGTFLKDSVEVMKNFKDSSYDLIIASYSLYFFPGILDEVARILKPDGVFITLTHSMYSLREITDLIPECIESIGINAPEEIKLNKLFMQFSKENGNNKLLPYFEIVEKIDFDNKMIFQIDHIDDCIYYIEKKRHLIYKEVLDRYPDMVVDLESCLSQRVFYHAKINKEIVITKDDAVFRCYNPQKPL